MNFWNKVLPLSNLITIKEAVTYYYPCQKITRMLEDLGYKIISNYCRDYLRTEQQIISDIMSIAQKIGNQE